MIYEQPKGMRKVIGLCCCFIMGAYGCVRPSLREIGDAEAAIAAIRAAGSGSYITEELKHIEEEKRPIKYNSEEYMDILSHFNNTQEKYRQEQYSEVIEEARPIISRCNALQRSIQGAEESEDEAKIEEPEPSDESGWLVGQEKERQGGLSIDYKEEQRYREYVVQRGDCLWKICRDMHVYNNPLSWPILYKANRAQIRNPDLIYPGQRLVIPR